LSFFENEAPQKDTREEDPGVGTALLPPGRKSTA
jgi:hypothetical protein